MTLRDILSWIDFLVLTVSRDKNSIWWGFVHGAALSVLDGLATATDLAISEAEHFRKNAFEFLLRPLIEEQGMEGLASEIMRSVGVVKEKEASSVITSTKRQFGIKPFLISKGPDQDDDVDYAFDAPTTRHNLMRLLRALQLERRPILLEGSPGVGKTSLVMALGKLSGNRVTRINLSDQTDLSDLFGADLPCSSSEEGNEDGAGAMFKWVDGALLRAMRKGEWCLIDELNLAGQPVLEGLNALFDHRRTVFIPAIGKTFECHRNFRCFACQNPLHEGGGRKGLPKSFVNRFTRVHVSALSKQDILHISNSLRPVRRPLYCKEEAEAMRSCKDALSRIVHFNSTIQEDTMVKRLYGLEGSPWEFNLRDILRWLSLLRVQRTPKETREHPASFVELLYVSRFRNEEDKARVRARCKEIFGVDSRHALPRDLSLSITKTHVMLGNAILGRSSSYATSTIPPTLLEPLEHLMKCVEMDWPALLVGPSGSGKSEIVKRLAKTCGRSLTIMSMSSGVDASELLGCYEQMELSRHIRVFASRIIEHVDKICIEMLTSGQDITENGVDVVVKVSRLMSSRNNIRRRVTSMCESEWVEIMRDLETLIFDDCPDSSASMELSKAFKILYKKISSNIQGRFEWIDGALVRAVQNGGWVLLDNVNLCSPSVLDRLNSLLETSGTLLLTECGPDTSTGKLREIKRHSSFRLICTMNPKLGQVSRAFRNRCAEIAMNTTSWSAEDVGGNDFVLESWARVLQDEGIIPALSPNLSLIMFRAHVRAMNSSSSMVITSRHLRHWSRVVHKMCSRGVNISKALRIGFRLTYGVDFSELKKEELHEEEEEEVNIETVPHVANLPLGLWNESTSRRLLSEQSFRTLFFTMLAFVKVHNNNNNNSLFDDEKNEETATNTPLGILIEVLQKTIDQTYLDPSVSEAERLEAAIITFCNDATEKDWFRRLRSVSAMLHALEMEQNERHLKLINILRGCIDIAKFMFQRRFAEEQIVNQISSAVLELRKRLELDQYVLSISLPPRDPVLFQRIKESDLDLYDIHCALVSLYQDEMIRMEDSRREHAILSSSKNTETPSIIQLSFLVQKGFASASRLPLSCLRLLPSLFVALDKGIGDVVGTQLLETLKDVVEKEDVVGKDDAVGTITTTPENWNEIRTLRMEVLQKRNELRATLHESTIEVDSLIIDVEAALLVGTARLQGVLETLLMSSELYLDERSRREIRLAFDRFSEALVRDCVKQSDFKLNASSLISRFSETAPLPMPARNKRVYDVMRSVKRALNLFRTSTEEEEEEEKEGGDWQLQLGLFLDSDNRDKLVGVLSTLRCALDSEDMILTAENMTQSILKSCLSKQQEQKSLLIRSRNHETESSYMISDASLIHVTRIETTMLADLMSNSFMSRCKKMLTLLIKSTQTRRSLVDVIEWQHLLWRMENDDDDDESMKKNVFDLIRAWHMASWNTSETTCLGDSEYTKSLVESLHEVTYEKLPVEEYRTSVNVLVALQNEICSKDSRFSADLLIREEDGRVLWEMICHGISCLRFDDCGGAVGVFGDVVKDLKKKKKELLYEIEQNLIPRLTNKELQDKMKELLVPSIKLLLQKEDTMKKSSGSSESSSTSFWKHRGEAWIRFGLFQMFVSIPNLPIDPQVPDMLNKYHLDRSLRRAQAIEEIERLKLMLSGGIELEDDDEDENDLMGYNNNVTKLQISKNTCHELGKKLRSQKPSRYRPDDVKFRSLYVGVRSYVDDFGNAERILSLAKRLTEEDKDADKEEEHWQQSTSKFVKFLSDHYELSFCDVVTPILTAIGHVRRGVRILRHAKREDSSSKELREIATSLSSFPSSEKPAILAQKALKAASFPQVNRRTRRVLCKAALETLREASLYTSEEVHALNDVSKLCVRLWKQAEAERERRRAEEEKAVEFKERTLEIKSDQEVEDEECREMFPEFSSHYDDIIGVERDMINDDDDEKKNRKDTSGLTLEEQQRLVEVMISIKQIKNEDEMRCSRTTSFQARFEAARHLLSLIPPRLSSSKNMDDTSLGGVFMSASLHLENMLISGDDMFSGDLHKDFSIHEAKLVYPHLKTLSRKLQELDSKFPENEVLILLQNLTRRILKTSLRAPLMQIVVGTELLLQRAQSAWEPYVCVSRSFFFFFSILSSLTTSHFLNQIRCTSRSSHRRFEASFATHKKMASNAIGILESTLRSRGKTNEIECFTMVVSS